MSGVVHGRVEHMQKKSIGDARGTADGSQSAPEQSDPGHPTAVKISGPERASRREFWICTEDAVAIEARPSQSRLSARTQGPQKLRTKLQVTRINSSSELKR